LIIPSGFLTSGIIVKSIPVVYLLKPIVVAETLGGEVFF
jgi:hypothetical protein